MSKKIINEETGLEEIVYTQAEIDAQIAAKEADFNAKLADKDQHVATKLKEFETGKTASALKEQEWTNKLTETERIAKEAAEKANATEQKRLDTIKDMIAKNYTGGDPELTKKFDEAWPMVNLEIKEDGDIAKRAEMVAKLAGLDTGNNDFSGGGMPMGGGYAPNFVKKTEDQKTEDNKKFQSELGLDKFIQEQAGPGEQK